MNKIPSRQKIKKAVKWLKKSEVDVLDADSILVLLSLATSYLSGEIVERDIYHNTIIRYHPSIRYREIVDPKKGGK